MGGFEEYSVLLVVGLRNILLPIVVVVLFCFVVLLVVGLRNILLPIVVVVVLLFCCFVGGGFEEYSVAYCCCLLLLPIVVVLFCCFVGGLLDVNFDKDRRGGWMQGGGKSRGCIRINLILLILYNYSRTPFYRLLRHE